LVLWLWRPSSSSASWPSEAGRDDGFDPLFGADPDVGRVFGVSWFTGRAASLPAWEQEAIVRIARDVGVDPVALAAIRLAEQGGAGREFGVLSVPAPSYEDQARVAAQSIAANMQRAGVASITDEFWRVMGARWAPEGAANDPTGLNRHWVRNVSAAFTGSALAV
jgi:hypothetical protein